MIGQCAGGCGANVSGQECFCKGCQWTITLQYQTSVANRIIAQSADTIGAPNLTSKSQNHFPTSEICASALVTNISETDTWKTVRQPRIGFTTDPYFQMAGGF